MCSASMGTVNLVLAKYLQEKKLIDGIHLLPSGRKRKNERKSCVVQWMWQNDCVSQIHQEGIIALMASLVAKRLMSTCQTL